MSSTSTAAADPGLDPTAVLSMVVESLSATEASIARLQAVKEGFLAIAVRVATELAECTDPADLPEAVRGLSAEIAERSVAAEIGAALRVSDRTIQRRMAQAGELASRFPTVLDALANARISLPHARMIQDAGAAIADDAAREAFTARVLPIAENDSPNRARPLIRREAERAAPRDLTERHREAQKQRRIWREDLPDGQKMLGMIHSAAVIDGIHDRLSQQARAVQVANARAAKPDAVGSETVRDAFGDPHDVRTIDQLRADLVADVLLSGAPSGHDTPAGLLGAIRARVEFTVPVLTLLGRDSCSGAGARDRGSFDDADRFSGDGSDAGENGAPFPGTGFEIRAELPGELAGGSPIDTDTARLLAGGVVAWERVLTHPVTGAILAVDRYRPNADLKRLLHARDLRCRFPGCGLPPVAQDLDHTVDAALGGTTDIDNLDGCCRRHHVVKHHGRWAVTQLGAGILEWTSPTGRTYLDRPPSPVTFTVCDSDPPPLTDREPVPF